LNKYYTFQIKGLSTQTRSGNPGWSLKGDLRADLAGPLFRENMLGLQFEIELPPEEHSVLSVGCVKTPWNEVFELQKAIQVFRKCLT
jgi:hypothetical protein